MKRSFFLLFFICITTSICFAQDKVELDNTKTNQVSDIYNFKQNTSNYLLLNQIGAQSIQSQRSSTIIIQQVGDRNTTKSRVSGTSSSLNYLQIGNDNSIQSSSLINTASENIVQRGSDNSLTNFSFGNVDTSSLQVLQNGNNLTFEKFGTNALSNSLQFRISGDNQTVIVRSFNQ